MWFPLFVFALIDGLVGRNPQLWAAPVRAGLVAALFFVGLALIWRTGVRLSIGTAVLVGVLAALVVADIYQRVSFGISTWLIYAGAYALQRTIKRDWTRDFAIVGVLLTAVIWIVVIGTIDGVPKPATMWNRNPTGGLLIALLPAATTLPGRQRWIIPAVIVAGILMTTSRGAMLGAAVGLAVIIQPWALLVAPALAAGLALIMRRDASVMRLVYFTQAMEAWRSSIWFGVGPGLQLPEEGIHAHNTLLGLLAQAGIVGWGIMISVIALARRVHFERWQLATLAAVGAHSLVDDPACWLPVGIVVSLILASENATAMRVKSV